MKLIKIFSATLFIFFLLWYIYKRTKSLLPTKKGVRRAFTVLYLFFSVLLGLCSTILDEHVFPFQTTRFISFVGYSFLVFLLYFAISLAFIDLVGLTPPVKRHPKERQLAIRRRAAGFLAVIVLIVMGIGHYRFNHPQVVVQDIVYGSNLSRVNPDKQTPTLTIVAASDLHLGVNISRSQLEQYVEQINRLSPDLIVLVGDIMNHSLYWLKEEQMQDIFSRLSARYGVYAVLGNHEYYAGHIPETIDFLRTAGIPVLRDSACLVASQFWLAGRDDLKNRHRKPLHELLDPVRQFPVQKPVILLDHQPFNLDEACREKVLLQLSGHTHYGQLIPFNWLEHLLFEKPYGYLKKDETHYYISSGLGIWGPLYRIGTQSEIVKIRLFDSDALPTSY